MNKTLANILSYAFHPLLMPSYLYVVLLYIFGNSIVTINAEARPHLIILVFLMTFIIPVVSTFTLVKTSVIASIQMEDRRERTFPFLFTTCIYAVVSYFFYMYFKGSYLFTVILLMTSGILLTTAISYFWKISAHAVGLGGFLGFLYVFVKLSNMQEMLLPFVFVIVVSGFVISARMALSSHNLWQVFAGFVLGVANSLLILFFG